MTATPLPQGPTPRVAAPSSRFPVALAVCLLVAASPPRALEITWPRDLFNPKPRPDDVLVPLPCGGAMAFRWVQAEGAVPAGASAALAPLYRLRGPFAHDGGHYLLIGKYEVAELQYRALAAAGTGTCPEIAPLGRMVQGRVGWIDAMGAAVRGSRWLAETAGGLPDCASGAVLCAPRQGETLAVLRLANEAEWEYAARGGLAVAPAQFAESLYPMDGGLEAHVWYQRNTDGKLKPIGYREPNPLGLHDIYGNVEELTLAPYRSPQFPGQVGAAAIRGGSVHTKREDLSASRRNEVPLYGAGGANRAPDNGFRLVLDLPAGETVASLAPLPPPTRIDQPAALGHLQVNVDVPARVRLDGLPAGQAAPGKPLELTGLGVGEHRIALDAEGYATASEHPHIEANRWTQVTTVMQSPGAVPSGGMPWRVILGGLALAWLGYGLLKRRRRPRLLAPIHAFEPEMIALPGGEFWMGSPEREPERYDDEGPRHRVRIKPFAIGKTAVTFAQYDAFAKATGREYPRDAKWGRGDRPVIHVSWEDAVSYAQWLSGQTGRPYRLPSEAEWEYAARAGTKTPFSTGRCIHTNQANYYGDYDYNGCGAKTGVHRGRTVPVGSLPANPWGLHEVHGNVWEWVQDRWHGNYNGAPTDGSAWEGGDAAGRMLRGGSWSFHPRNLRAAKRYCRSQHDRDINVGFRIARTLPL